MRTDIGAMAAWVTPKGNVRSLKTIRHFCQLLAAVSASARVAIPSGCYMESFSAFEDEKGRRNWFRDEVDKQIKQLRRDTTSAKCRYATRPPRRKQNLQQ